MSRMTLNGVTITNAKGQEQYEEFMLGRGHRAQRLVQYDYRHTNGKLFFCVKKTLQLCRDARDAWVVAGAN